MSRHLKVKYILSGAPNTNSEESAHERTVLRERG